MRPLLLLAVLALAPAAATYTRPTITSTVRMIGTHHHVDGRFAATTHPIPATRITCPDGKLS